MLTDPLIGQLLGNFRLDRLLGHGGMALVYYGWDTKLERPVAVKVIDARFRHSPAYAARFIREARAVAAWRHENIIQIFYADEQEELYYFVMEYIKGLDLRELMAEYHDRNELMPHADVIHIGRAIANALDYAHQNNVIHRDVKPANVMLAEDGRIVLTDFGLALDLNQGSLGEVFGSPHYIAPEQARHSADAVPQSDLYSLGIILYEMLTGAVPFDDPSATVVALQHVTQPPPPPCERNPALPAPAEAVLLRALSKQPEERYPTGQELLDALETALQEAAPALSIEPGSDVKRLSLISVNEKITAHMNVEAAPGAPDSQNPDLDLIGMELDEYRLEALLGHGGMARVYQGLDVRLNRKVAIKVIDTPFRAEADYLMRFEREAQAIARLEHPHIVRLYRYGEDHGLLYMAMQYIDGADLESILSGYQADNETMEAADIKRIIRQVGEALDYAHSQGIIHRDVKPANVMLDKQGHAILTDFGLALLTEAGTRGLTFGSPHYIAPEQAVSSANVVPQSDLYAVGVMLYEIFTGRLPFNAEDPLQIAMMHMSSTPPPPREIRPELSPALEAVILQAMAQDPQARYPTGVALADALDQALPEPASAPQPISRKSIPDRVQAHLSLPVVPNAFPTPPPPPVEVTPAPTAEAISQSIETIKVVPIPPPPPAVSVSGTIPQAATEIQVAVITDAGPTPPPAAIPPADFPPPPAITPETTTTTSATVTVIPIYTTAAPTEEPAITVTPVAAPVTDSTPPSQPITEMAPTILSRPVAPVTPVTATPAPAPVTPTATAVPTPPSPTEASVPVKPAPAANRPVVLYIGIGIGICLLLALVAAASIFIFNLLQPKNTVTPTPMAVIAEPTSTETAVPETIAPTEPATILAVESTSTPEPTPTPEPTSTPEPITGELILAFQREDGFWVMNNGTTEIPLAQLKLGDGDTAITGDRWGLENLAPGSCLIVWKEKGNPALPNLPEVSGCATEDPLVRVEGKKVFWSEKFAVYYHEESVGECPKEHARPCTISFTLP